uniref:Chemosensory protein 9 n=1 Tax=Sogatella furcifera TaxID=113103 RepID=A0A096W1I8_SOGFU|nr:chemosensory protein 9 [Sogatella furcifera]
MRCLLLVAVVFAAFIAAARADEANKYTSKYDNIDIDKILKNDRVLSQYIKCLMGEGSCTQEGRELKRLLPDAIQSNCSKCSEKQRQASVKVMRHLRQSKERDWNRLLDKYDPQGDKRKNLKLD